jgi:hypothetical protein
MFGRGGSRDNKTKDVEQMHLWLSRLDEPLEIAHEIGESFFKPVDTANVLVNQAVLRSDRMSRLEQRYGLLSSAQVAQLSGSKARNKAQIAHRWLKQGKIFAVPIQGAVRFPGFQFDEFGQPRGVIADILTVLPMERGWATAFWFDNPNSVICENKSPAQVLDSDPAAALEAARAAHSRAEEDWA